MINEKTWKKVELLIFNESRTIGRMHTSMQVSTKRMNQPFCIHNQRHVRVQKRDQS